MPLNKSKSEQAFHQNVSEMIKAGHPQKQALAAAYRVQRGFDDGGTVDPVMSPGNPNPIADNPFSNYVAQKLYGLGQNAVSALSVPGEVWKGNLDPTSDEGMNRAIGLAQMITEAPRGGGAGPGTVLGSGMRAYHASPHDFDAFDMSKVGTGIGHNYRGEGIYFTQQEPKAAAIQQQYFPSGKVYEADIAADPATMLHWDEPLSKQPHVQAALDAAGIDPGADLPSFMRKRLTGKDAMETLLNVDTPKWREILNDPTISTNQQGARKYLDKNGIPGIVTSDKDVIIHNDRLIDILRKYGMKNGEKYASGGNVLPFYARSGAWNLEHSGFIHSPVPGRTDRLPMGVKGGSYVLPADTVSAVGQGNSLAGAHSLSRLFGMGPYGSTMPHIHSVRPQMPKLMNAPRPPKFARGGSGPVDIVAAGGEMIIPPHIVLQIGKGDMQRGHDILDAFVKHTRAKTVKKLKSLPGPKKK
jgi:hypothetical protein